jgi:hypothetical protein
LNGHRGEESACGSFASTDDGVVAGSSTEAGDGLVQDFLRVGVLVEELACISTLGAEVGRVKAVGNNPEV